MNEHKSLTDFQKSEIIALEPHYSHAEISRQLDIPRSTIVDFIQRTRNRQSIDNLPHPGRPRETTNRTNRYFVHLAESNTRVPLKEIKNKSNVTVCEQTIRRRLHDFGIRKWRAVNRALLTQNHVIKRLEWAKQHRHWTRKDWEKVLWSDESAVKKDSDARTIWVFRRQNKKEKYAPQNVRGKRKDNEVCQMVWGCFISDKLGPLVCIDEHVTQDIYIETLRQNLLPFIDILKDDGVGTNLIFQQDNARPHTARKTKDWLAEMAEEFGFTVIDWPPNSPDLNPIENLWSILKANLVQRYPDMKYIPGGPETVRSVLKSHLTEMWWEIEPETLNRLIDSMPHRVEAVLHAKGWYTKY
jgi:hypothetical protein